MDSLLELFKGQLSLTELLNMPYKLLMELRMARLERLQKEEERMTNEMNTKRDQ